jgi:UDP-glucuronate decarboxylase
MNVATTPDGPVNLGNPAEFTVRELAQMVLDMTGSRSVIRSLPLPVDDPRRRRPDISRAGNLLGWKPAVSLHEGLTKTIQYFLKVEPNADAMTRLPTFRNGTAHALDLVNSR